MICYFCPKNKPHPDTQTDEKTKAVVQHPPEKERGRTGLMVHPLSCLYRYQENFP